MQVETVKVVRKGGRGWHLRNKSDLTEADKLYEEPKPKAEKAEKEPKPKAE